MRRLELIALCALAGCQNPGPPQGAGQGVHQTANGTSSESKPPNSAEAGAGASAPAEPDRSSAGAAAAAAGQGPSAGAAGAAGRNPSEQAGSGGNAADGGVDDPDDAGQAIEQCLPRFDPKKPPTRLELTGELAVRDPTIVQTTNGDYFVIGSGRGLPALRSSDLMSWRKAPNSVDRNPGWIMRNLPDATELWAPEAVYLNGLLHMYFAAGRQGENRSCIGHAISQGLGFSDRGTVICSNLSAQDKDDWNAIDPAFVQDENGQRYLAFGSFWSGIKLIELDADGGRKNDKLMALAARPNAGGALEAPYVLQNCGYFYLFVSFDRCCDGARSTQRIVVGRSRHVEGPYVDRAGVPMLEGGGTLVVEGDDVWRGPGHSAVIRVGERMYEVHRAYYAGPPDARYRVDGSFLRISELTWDDAGWPVAGGP